MPITREKKDELVAEYTEKFSRSQAAFLTHYRGLTVTEITDLRRRLQGDGNDVEYTIAKNTLIRLALQQAGLPVPEDLLEGPTAVVFVYGDPTAPAKALNAYVNTNEKVTVRGGLFGASILDADGVKRIAALPSREVILATLLGSVQGPASSLVSTLMAPMREIAYILAQRGESGAEAAPAEAEVAA